MSMLLHVKFGRVHTGVAAVALQNFFFAARAPHS